MTAAESHSPAPSESRERKIIFLLCILAALHVFIFSAAFPFFNNVDEQYHFDLIEKYTHGIPRGIETISEESVPYIVLDGTVEYFGSPTNYPNGTFPPPAWTWPQSDKKIAAAISKKEAKWRTGKNLECSQPPLYYTLGGIWWNVGCAIGIKGVRFLYWLRFLNIIFAPLLVWLGYRTAQILFPLEIFPRLAIPAFLAFFPQTTFYSLNNDVLSSVCFGAAFICLIKFWRAKTPSVRLAAILGTALAATFLVKMTNLPLIALALAAAIFKFFKPAKNWRNTAPSLAALLLCAALPMMAWMAWCKIHFGDFAGASEKIKILGWTVKPVSEWFHHPIFSPHGLWIYLQGQLATFWQGEFYWHDRPMGLPALNVIYTVISLVVPAVAFSGFFKRSATAIQRDALALSFLCIGASLGFFALMSVVYDFHDCFYPSRSHPYFTSGRLILGALIPFLLLFVYGIDSALNRFGTALKFSALAAIILLMLTGEIVTDWPVFSSQYNWFHM